jgi:pimeloyl-ACP methyl ester carboxylesterase
MSTARLPGAGEVTARHEGFSLPVLLSGQGVPLLFLHGLGSDSRDSRRDLGAMPGIRLALADQRGHGSARPPVSHGEFELDSLVGDLRAMIRALGWPGPVVGGGSMGAAVALRHVLTDPGDCQALVLVAPAIGPDRPAAAALIASIGDRIDAVGLEQAVAELRGLSAPTMASRDGAGTAGEGSGGDGLDCWLRQDAGSLAVAMRAVQRWRPLASLSELSALQVPVALVGIRDDPLHPVELAIQMHARLPHSSLEILGSPDDARRPGAIGGAVLRGLATLGLLQRGARNS